MYSIDSVLRVYPSRCTLLQPVLTPTARNNRSVQGVREDGEHCTGPKWQIDLPNGIGSKYVGVIKDTPI